MGRPRGERKSRPALRLVEPPRAHPSRPDADPSREHLARRLPWLAAAYLALGTYGLLVGAHPMATSTVVTLASATSAGLVALIASQRMLDAPYLVGLASLAASSHAWAQACVPACHVGATSFALTVIAGAFVCHRPRHVAAFVAAVVGAYSLALGASALDRPLTTGLELLAASALALAITAARHRRLSNGVTSRA